MTEKIEFNIPIVITYDKQKYGEHADLLAKLLERELSKPELKDRLMDIVEQAKENVLNFEAPPTPPFITN